MQNMSYSNSSLCCSDVSSHSCSTSSSDSSELFLQQIKQKCDENCQVSKKGYKITKFLTTTLQGDISLATRVNSNNSSESLVIKRTSKELHNRGITIMNDIGGGTVICRVKENIVREANILKTLNFSDSNNVPTSLIKYIDFFETANNYYLVMENGGTSFFEFIEKAHALIASKKLRIEHWTKQVKFMFSQMIQFQKWMHHKGFCNLDISLENMLISHDCYFDSATGKFKNCYIKFIDFGLSEQFNGNDFRCCKFVGKRNYQSPKVIGRIQFDAREADMWSLGIVLFAMLAGTFPWNKACDSDPFYKLVKDGNNNHWMGLLKKFGVKSRFSANSLDLVKSLLSVNTLKRMNMNQICSHPWIRVYFECNSSSSNNQRKKRKSRSFYCSQIGSVSDPLDRCGLIVCCKTANKQ